MRPFTAIGWLTFILSLACLSDEQRQAMAEREAAAEKRKLDWKTTINVNPVDDTKEVIVSKLANETYKDWVGREHRPALVVQCAGNKTDVRFDLDGPPDNVVGHHEEAKLTIRLDKDPATSSWGDLSTTGRAVFHDRPIPLIKSWTNHSTLLLQWTPFKAPAANVSFDLTGADDAMKPIREACGW